MMTYESRADAAALKLQFRRMASQDHQESVVPLLLAHCSLALWGFAEARRRGASFRRTIPSPRPRALAVGVGGSAARSLALWGCAAARAAPSSRCHVFVARRRPSFGGAPPVGTPRAPGRDAEMACRYGAPHDVSRKDTTHTHTHTHHVWVGGSLTASFGFLRLPSASFGVLRRPSASFGFLRRPSASVGEVLRERGELARLEGSVDAWLPTLARLAEWEDERSDEVVHSIPFHSIPSHPISFHFIPFQSITSHSITFHTIPFHPIPFRSIT